MRIAALSVIVVALAQCRTPIIAQVVRSEAGFDGAVTIAGAAIDNDLEYVTANVPYLDVHGQAKMGQARLIMKRSRIAAGRPLPAFCHVHYEKGVDGAREWCQRGWAVATAHYGGEQGEYAIEPCVGDSYNLAKAIIEWVRRQPCIDRSRLHIEGGSAGGYMALAMDAEMFPVTSAVADAPVANLAYNLHYLEANKAAAQYPNTAASPLPVLCAVIGLSDQAKAIFGREYADDTWYYLSPISYLDRITAPTAVLCATGDMLVPHEQMTDRYPRPITDGGFPAEYVRDFETLTLCDKARVRFDELIPEANLLVSLIAKPAHLQEWAPEKAGETKSQSVPPSTIERPFDPVRQWAIAVLDEGPPLPYSGHTRYEWRTSAARFVEYYQQSAPAPSLLNAAKIERLLRRYAGELNEQALLGDGTPVHRTNYALLEQLDVVTGLLDYVAMGEAHAQQLLALYATAPVRPFGDTLTLEQLRARRADLLTALGIDGTM